MTTTATRNGKTISLTVEQKARMLSVIEEHPELAENELAVTSGSIFGSAYVLKHNGRVTLACPCGAYTPKCAHRIAGNWHLEAKNRAAYNAAFDPNGVN